MKLIHTISMLIAAALITLGANAQTATTPAKQDSKTTTSKSDAKPNMTLGDVGVGTIPGPSGTKTGDKINKNMKGPNGETVYTDPKGDFYIVKDGSRKYLPKKK